MVSRPTEQQILNLQIAEYCTAWIVSFMAACRAEKKEININAYDTISDPQITNLFLSMCGKDALLKFRYLMSPKKQLDTLFNEIRLVIQKYTSPKERVITAERAKFLSVVQSLGESHHDFLARLSEEARYCDLRTLKTVTNPDDDLLKI